MTTLSVTGVPAMLPAGVSYNAGTHSFTLNPADAAYQHLAAGATTTVSVLYQVSDGTATTSASVSWTVTGTNDIPVAAAATNAATEGGAVITGSVVATDADDGASLSYSLTDPVPAGLTFHTDGSYSFDPTVGAYDHLAAGATQDVVVHFKANDGTADSNVSTLTITVTGTNDAPVVTSGAQSGAATEIADRAAGENTADHTQTGTITYTDADTSDVHTATFVPAGANTTTLGTFSLDNSSIDATAHGGSVGWNFTVNDAALDYLQAGQVVTQSYSVSIGDGLGAPVTQSVTVTLTGTNDAPFFYSDAFDQQATSGSSIIEIADNAAGENTADHTRTGTLTYTDVDTLDVHAATFVPAAANTTALGTFSLDTGSIDTGHGGSIGWNFTVNDAALDHLKAGETVIQSYDVTVNDGHGGTATKTVTISLVGANDAPVGSATASLAAGTEDTAYTVSASDLLAGFSDVDGDTLSVSGLSANHGTVVDNHDGTFTITPTSNYNGDVALSYSVVDGNGGSLAGTQHFTLAAVNDAPVGSATASLAAGTEDTAYTVSASDLLAGFSDVDGDTLSVSSLSANHGTVADNHDGTFTITPAANYSGDVTLSYSVIDGNGGSVAGTQHFTLAAVNDAPVGSATASLAAGTEDTAYTVSASDLLAGFSDVDGDTLSVSSLTANHGAVVDNGNGTFTITPTSNYNGDVTLSYSVVDGNGGSVAGTQHFTLAAVNDAPVGSATASLAAGTEDTAYTVSASDLLAGFSDVDGDTLSVSSLSANHGTVADNHDGTFTITPAANYSGDVTLSYSVIDGNGGSVAGTQHFALAAVNDPAVITGDTTAALTETNAVLSTAGTLNVTDVDSSPTFVPQTNVAGNHAYGHFSVDATGAWTYTMDSAHDEFAQGHDYTDGLTVATADGTTQAITVTMHGTNDAPVFDSTPSSTLQVDENSTSTGFQFSAHDVDSSSWLFGIETGGDGSLFDVDASGNLTFKVAPDYENPTDLNHDNTYQLTVSVTDTEGAKTTTEVSVHVNDLPGLTINDSNFGDVITGSEEQDTIYGNGGSDTITALGGDDFIDAGSGDDTVYAGTGSDNVIGGAGNDKLYGEAGNDTLNGGSGNDLIVGGVGSDILTGGSSLDTFQYNAVNEGSDTITDFVRGQDKLEFDHTAFGLIQNGTVTVTNGATLGAVTETGTDAQFIFTSSDHTLWYDANGGGTSDAVEIAKLTGVNALTSSDFHSL